MTIDKTSLLLLMEEMSEEYYCAGWATYCEIDLWEAAQSTSKDGYEWGQGKIPRNDCEQLKILAEACGGWWIHGSTSSKFYKKKEESRVFVPFNDWEELYKKIKRKIKKLSATEFANAINKKFDEMERKSK
ncbi:hypothetical protein ACFL6P_09700 [Candidatus Latescibacterota bacterium]